MTNQQQQYRDEAIIEAAATSTFGTYSPVAAVKCPHCGGTMQAIDAKAHVRSAALMRQYSAPTGRGWTDR